jgi:hypothetical protein
MCFSIPFLRKVFYNYQKDTIGHGTKLHKTDFKSFIHSKACYQQAKTHWMDFALAPPWADLNHPFQWILQELARVFD